jgi:His-Xaa-Ser system protein HxsD
MKENILTKDITDTVVIYVDKISYDLEVVEASIIPLSLFTTSTITDNVDSYKVEIKKDIDSEITLFEIEKAYKNNLIHESLRKKIFDKTEVERNLILAYTFSNTKLME